MSNQAIVHDAPFEPVETLETDTDVGIAAEVAPPGPGGGLAPAGGPGEPSVDESVFCTNAFLDDVEEVACVSEDEGG